MTFQFPLATVLRVRLLREEREERRLQEIFQEIGRTRQSIERMNEELRKTGEGRAVRRLRPAAGHDIRLESRTAEALWECRQGLTNQLEALEQLRDTQIGLYQTARREREMLTELQSKQRMAFDTSLLVQEQRMLDDNFNARRRRS